jgi:hypothetical protein
MTGNRTLTDSDPVLQYLDPNGADRTVNLPVLTSNTPFFIIRHIGTADFLTVRADSGSLVAELSAGEAIQLQHDGTGNIGATVVDLTGGISLGSPLVFNGDITSGSYFWANTVWSQGSGASEPDRYHVVAVRTRFTHLGWHIQNNSNSTIVVYVNGSAAANGVTTGASNDTGIVELSAPVIAEAGDVISLQQGTDTADTSVFLYGSPTLDEDAGYTYFFGSYLSQNNQLLWAGGSYQNQQTQTTVGGRTEMTVPLAATGLKIAIRQNGNATSTFQLWKNGSPVESFIPSFSLKTGSVYTSVHTLATTFAQGDTIAIERETVSGSITLDMTVRFLGVKGDCYPFAGSLTTFLRWPQVRAIPQVGGDSAGAIGSDGVFAVVRQGGVPVIGYRHATAPTNDHQLYKNGVFSEAMNMQSTGGVITSLTTKFEEGDQVSLTGPTSGTAPGESNYAVLFF